MKSKFFLLLLVAATIFQSCSYTDPDTNITLQVDVDVEAINSNPLAPGATWTNSKVIDLNAEFSDRYGIDLDENTLISFRVSAINASIDSESCKKLSDLTTTINIPDLQPITFSATGNTVNLACDLANYIQVPETAGQSHPVLEMDFAEAIVSGSSFSIDYSMTAAEQIDSAQAITFAILSTAEFKPND